MAFPPVSVVLFVDDRFLVIDGAHRVGASVICGFTHVPVIVIGDER
jgi:hypothetical protein